VSLDLIAVFFSQASLSLCTLISGVFADFAVFLMLLRFDIAASINTAQILVICRSGPVPDDTESDFAVSTTLLSFDLALSTTFAAKF
jgi:hypothetical protein